MKVLHVLHQLGIGGTEKTAYLMCQYLNSYDDIEADVYAFEGGIRAGQFVAAGIATKVGPAQELAEYVQERGYGMVHVHRGGWAEEWLDPLIETDVPVVETNIFGDGDRSEAGGRIKAHMFVSDYIKAWYLRGTVGELNNEERLHTVYNPIAPPPFTDEQIEGVRADMRRQLDLPADALVVGRIGRADNHHGLSVKAFKLLWSKGVNIFLVALNPTREMAEGLSGNPQVRLILEPAVSHEQVCSFYTMLDGLAHDRVDGETFGCCQAEAMSFGLPTVSHISRKYQGHLEIMSGDALIARSTLGIAPERIGFKGGRYKELLGGFITGVQDHEAYAECILSLPDKGMQDGDSMRELVDSVFHPAIIARQVRAIYRSVSE